MTFQTYNFFTCCIRGMRLVKPVERSLLTSTALYIFYLAAFDTLTVIVKFLWLFQNLWRDHSANFWFIHSSSCDKTNNGNFGLSTLISDRDIAWSLCIAQPYLVPLKIRQQTLSKFKNKLKSSDDSFVKVTISTKPEGEWNRTKFHKSGFIVWSKGKAECALSRSPRSPRWNGKLIDWLCTLRSIHEGWSQDLKQGPNFESEDGARVKFSSSNSGLR